MGRVVRSRLAPGGPRTLDAAGAGLRGPRGPPPLLGLHPGLWLPECSLEISHGFSFSEFSCPSALCVSGGLWPRARRRHIHGFRSVVLLSGGDSLPGIQECVLLPFWPGLVGSGELWRACPPPRACPGLTRCPFAIRLPQLSLHGKGRGLGLGQGQPAAHLPCPGWCGQVLGDSRGRRQRGTHHPDPGRGEECMGLREGPRRPL